MSESVAKESKMTNDLAPRGKLFVSLMVGSADGESSELTVDDVSSELEDTMVQRRKKRQKARNKSKEQKTNANKRKGASELKL